MAGVAGNVFTISFAKQSAKGAPASAADGYKLKLTGGDLAPNRGFLTLQETDATRQQGATVVVSSQIQGTPEWYVRPSDFGLIAYLALGSVVDTGAGPYTHTFTPAVSPPYFTAWKNVGAGLIIDRYSDLKVNTLEISGGAGQAILCRSEWMGLSALFGTTDNSNTAVSEAPYVYPMAAFKLNGSAPATTEQFTLTLNNNAEFIQADTTISPYDVVYGRMEATGSFTYLLQSDADYRTFHTGAPSGTAPTTTLFEQSIGVTLTNGTDVVDFETAGAAFTAYPVPPDASGKPIRVAATFSALPQTAIGLYMTVAVTNGVVSY